VKTPSIRKAASRFRNKVSKAAPIPGHYRNVARRLERMSDLYVNSSSLPDQPELQGGFGLGEVTSVRLRKVYRDGRPVIA
jgi:hypothetical protein